MVRKVFILSSDKKTKIAVNAYDNYFVIFPGQALSVEKGQLVLHTVEFTFKEGEFCKNLIRHSLKNMPQSFSVYTNYDKKKQCFFYSDIVVVMQPSPSSPNVYSVFEANETYSVSSCRLYNNRLVLKTTNRTRTANTGECYKNKTDLPIVLFSRNSTIVLNKKVLSEANSHDQKEIESALKRFADGNDTYYDDKTLESFDKSIDPHSKPQVNVRLMPYSVCHFLPENIDLMAVDSTYKGPVVRVYEWGHSEIVPQALKEK